MNVGDWIRKRAILSSGKTAVIFEEKEFSYRQVNERTNQLAHAMVDSGIKKGDRVAVLFYNCHQFLEVYFAAAKLGAIFVPLNFRLAGPELEFMLNNCGAEMLIYNSDLADAVDSIRSAIPVKKGNFIQVDGDTPSWAFDYEGLLLRHPMSEPEIKEEVELEDPQMIMYTSGTTGQPKGALLSHRKTFYNTFNADIYFDISSTDRMLVVMPLFHSGGLNITAVPILYKGGTAIIQKHFDPEEVLRLIERYKITLMMAVPTMLNFILKKTDMERYVLNSLRTCMTAGEVCPLSLIKEYQKRNIPIRQVFGQTETSIVLWLPEVDSIRKAGSVGLPVFHSDVKVVNRKGADVVPGEIGEIIVKGPIQMTDYWNLPEETARTIRGGWLHTGDLARVDDEGYVYIVDREKDMFISGGENVYPAEIEKVYAIHPKILESAVIGVADDEWGEVGKAIIALKEGETMTEKEALDFCKGKLAGYKTPKSVIFVDELPKTASGKIKKVPLRKKYGKPCLA
ncbi:MAG: long-chain fatty acid--CoA ligase [Thermodesulfobacteriota bacterium]